jgi:uncharacterized protein (TIGR03437 family)
MQLTAWRIARLFLEDNRPEAIMRTNYSPKLGGLLAILALAACPLLMAQDEPQNAGPVDNLVTSAGYTPPTLTKVAPGQVITLYVRISGAPITKAILAAGTPLPTLLGGFSVSLKQTFIGEPIAVPLIGIYPSDPCSGVAPCTPLTAIMVQIPFELVPNVPGSRMPFNFATLTVMQNGVAGDALPLMAVPDNIHVINSCDALPPATNAQCAPIFRHADGSVVTAANPAKSGEVLSMAAFGLGYPVFSVASGDLPRAPVSTDGVKLGFEFRANTPAVKPGSSQPSASAAISRDGVGLYQITFVVPAVPDGTPACGTGVTSNLTVSIGRTSSFDGAGLCVQP